ncbi:MAG TPA: branched-chain amino acid ABC transporter substrate-binding protein [Gammaproteobacteria bacterium]|nr:branched-chain amino acid ABC transporter substrate-binding protein [Gammaproteobacteria bacterium]
MRKLLTTLASAAALGLVLSAPVQAKDTLTVGVQVPTTGSEATYGTDMYNAMKIAADEINAKGGVLGKKIELTTGDSACDPQQSVNAASKLASQDVVGVVGGYCSGATLPTLKIYGDNNVPFVIVAANSTKLIPANPGNAFMINSTGFDQVKKAVGFFEKKGVKSLAIVNQGDAYSQDLANLTRNQWEKDGHKVAAYETVSKGEQSFASLVTKIKSSGADAVFWTAYYADGGLLIRQLRQGGFRGIIAVGDGSNSPKLFEIAGRAAEGVYGFSNPTADFLPEAKGFIKSYKDQFGNAPGPYAPLAYDGMHLLAWAIDKAGSTDHDAIEKALASVDGQSWLTGPISFTDKNTLARSNFIILKGEGGHWTLESK